jgi:hypothetical protein
MQLARTWRHGPHRAAAANVMAESQPHGVRLPRSRASAPGPGSEVASRHGFRRPAFCWSFAEAAFWPQEDTTMPPTLTDTALDYLLAAAGLDPTEAQKADLKSIHDQLAAMKDRVRQPRGRMAEPAHTFGFTLEDLAPGDLAPGDLAPGYPAPGALT